MLSANALSRIMNVLERKTAGIPYLSQTAGSRIRRCGVVNAITQAFNLTTGHTGGRCAPRRRRQSHAERRLVHGRTRPPSRLHGGLVSQTRINVPPIYCPREFENSRLCLNASCCFGCFFHRLSLMCGRKSPRQLVLAAQTFSLREHGRFAMRSA